MKKILTLLSIIAVPAVIYAQSVPTAIRISQHDLRGTARFMSMGGAFGALGGDLTCLSQNPGGIGVYRNSDIGITFGLDMIGSKVESRGFSNTENLTRFNLNDIGLVYTFRLNNDAVPNINFGFTYNKVASFNQKVEGRIPTINNSLSNYIAGLSNANNLTEADVTTTDRFDPYNPGYGQFSAPWLTILGYDALLTNPEGDPDSPHWYGQFGNGTTGSGSFSTYEKGSIDEYNIALGGNINNVVFWGIDFGITSIDYKLQSVWGESLDNAYVYDPNQSRVIRTESYWNLYDNYRVKGTGMNFKLGLIVKPIQELRLGLAFHTPTYYNLEETYYDTHIKFDYPFDAGYDSTWANDGYPAGNTFNFRTPWRVIASAAGVIGGRFIISADYEWATYNSMRYSEADNYGWYDPWYDWNNPWSDWGGWYGSPKTRSDNRQSFNNPNAYANSVIKQAYKNTSTLRLGAEFRIMSNLSVRAGYSYSGSPVKSEVKNGEVTMPGTGVLTSYTLDNETNYITCGLGYKLKGFYADLAYIFKANSSEYYPFSPDIADMSTAVKSEIKYRTSQLAVTLGYKF